MEQLVSKRYANALYELAIEENKIDQYFEEVDYLKNVLEQNEDFVKVLNHPHILKTEKMTLLKNTLGENISDSIYGLLQIIYNKNRDLELLDILNCFLGMVKEYKGILEARVISAVELNEESIEKIKDNLSKNLNKQISIITEVDPSILGGLIVLVDGRIIDGSVSSQLKNIKKQLFSSDFA